MDLRYELEALPIEDADDFEDGDDIYVELRPPSAGENAWTAVGAAESPDAFDDPVAYIRLSVEDRSIDTDAIGTYYASAEEAKRLERELVDGGIAEVVISEDGTPLLDSVRG